MASTGTFRIAEQTSRWSRFAQVTVEVSAADHDDAYFSLPGGGERGREAELGAWLALRAAAQSGGAHSVAITDLVATDVDTGVGDVYEAAARATWAAVNADPVPPYTGFSEPELVARWIRERRGSSASTARRPSCTGAGNDSS